SGNVVLDRAGGALQPLLDRDLAAVRHLLHSCVRAGGEDRDDRDEEKRLRSGHAPTLRRSGGNGAFSALQRGRSASASSSRRWTSPRSRGSAFDFTRRVQRTVPVARSTTSTSRTVRSPSKNPRWSRGSFSISGSGGSGGGSDSSAISSGGGPAGSGASPSDATSGSKGTGVWNAIPASQ